MFGRHMPLSVIWLLTSFAIRLLVVHFKLIILLRSREDGATGKVLKTKLRELYGNRDPAAISQTKTP